MDRFPNYLLYAVFATLAGLLLGSILGGLVLAGMWEAQYSSGPLVLADLVDLTRTGGFLAMIAAFLGLPVALLWGAPMYAWVAWKRRAGVLPSLAIGLVPALVMLPFSLEWALLMGLFGLPVSLITHWIAAPRVRALRPAPSLEPEPTLA